MSDDTLTEIIEKAVLEEIDALGRNPSPEEIADIVAKHAKKGAGSESAIADQAAERAREYLDQGVAPEAAASAAGAQAHQEVVSARPSMQEQMDDLFKQQGTTKDERRTPTADEIVDFTKDAREKASDTQEAVPISGKATSALTPFGEAVKGTDVSPELAAQAQLAIADAGSGGAILPTGLDIHGKLKVTVHDYVDLTYQSSQIKTTVLNTTYTHQNDVDIFATNVRLSAKSIIIEPTGVEKNWVKGSKESYISGYAYSSGTSNETETTEDYNSLFLATGAVATTNFHYAPVKAGFAVRMDTQGGARFGIEALTYVNSDVLTRNTNKMFMTASILLLLL